MKKISAKRKHILTVTFFVATIFTLGLTTFSGYCLAEKYKKRLEYTYVRAMQELVEYVNNIEHTLIKSLYTNTTTQQISLLSKLRTEANCAKTSLSELPLYDSGITNISKFITQTGDFAYYLTNSISKKNAISTEDRNTLLNLSQYAKTISNNLQQVVADFQNGSIRIGKEIESDKTVIKSNTPITTDVSSRFKEIEDAFSEYPTLIYDGPFSDHMSRVSPKLTKGTALICAEEAKDKAAKFLDMQPESLTFAGETDGTLPFYKFTTTDIEIAITKSGGFVNYAINARMVGPSTIDIDTANQLASEFLSSKGFCNMHARYYQTSNNICTINFTFVQDQIICYSDLIKVSVALDTGEVVSFQATGFIMNHTTRPPTEIIITKEAAQQQLVNNLTVLNSHLVYSPTPSLDEILCYEFECISDNNEKILSYINVKTGWEEQIFILTIDENGMLVS